MALPPREEPFAPNSRIEKPRPVLAIRIDISGPASRGFDQSSQGSLSTAAFGADLGAAMNGVLAPNQAVLFTANGGTLSGHVLAVIDANGQAGYQSGGDLVIELVDAVLPVDPNAHFIM
jgi:hypothetical protein